MPAGPARVLIEARPGAGKTTAVIRLSELLREAGVSLSGFVTRELREARRRVGFEIETFGGERGVLASVQLAGPPRVGRYGVDLEAFERLALPALDPSGDAAVVLIDERGKWSSPRTAFVTRWPRSSTVRIRSSRPFRWPGTRSRTRSRETPKYPPYG